MAELTYSFKPPPMATQVRLFLDGKMHSLHNVVPGEDVEITVDVEIGVEHKFQVFIAMEDRIKAWCYDHGHNPENPPLIICKMLDRGLSYEQVADALEAFSEVCPSCQDAPRDCQCWNDE